MTQLPHPVHEPRAPANILREGVLTHRSGTPSRRVGVADLDRLSPVPSGSQRPISASRTASGLTQIPPRTPAQVVRSAALERIGSPEPQKTSKAAFRQAFEGCLGRPRCLQSGTWKTLGEHVQDLGVPAQESTSKTGLPGAAWRTLQNSTIPPHSSTAIQNPYRVVEKHPNHCNDATCVVESTEFSTVWPALYEDDDSFYQGGDQARALENSTRTENETVTP